MDARSTPSTVPSSNRKTPTDRVIPSRPSGWGRLTVEEKKDLLEMAGQFLQVDTQDRKDEFLTGVCANWHQKRPPRLILFPHIDENKPLTVDMQKQIAAWIVKRDKLIRKSVKHFAKYGAQEKVESAKNSKNRGTTVSSEGSKSGSKRPTLASTFLKRYRHLVDSLFEEKKKVSLDSRLHTALWWTCQREGMALLGTEQMKELEKLHVERCEEYEKREAERNGEGPVDGHRRGFISELKLEVPDAHENWKLKTNWSFLTLMGGADLEGNVKTACVALTKNDLGQQFGEAYPELYREFTEAWEEFITNVVAQEKLEIEQQLPLETMKKLSAEAVSPTLYEAEAESSPSQAEDDYTAYSTLTAANGIAFDSTEADPAWVNQFLSDYLPAEDRDTGFGSEDSGISPANAPFASQTIGDDLSSLSHLPATLDPFLSLVLPPINPENTEDLTFRQKGSVYSPHSFDLFTGRENTPWTPTDMSVAYDTSSVRTDSTEMVPAMNGPSGNDDVDMRSGKTREAMLNCSTVHNPVEEPCPRKRRRMSDLNRSE